MPERKKMQLQQNLKSVFRIPIEKLFPILFSASNFLQSNIFILSFCIRLLRLRYRYVYFMWFYVVWVVVFFY